MSKFRHLSNVFFFLLTLCSVSSFASAASLTLAWDANMESDLAGYKVYQRSSIGSYGAPVGSTNSSTTQYVVTGLNDGATYYFSVSAYDTSNNESVMSSEVMGTTPPASDVTPPVRSNGQPSGSLAAGTTQATISLATNEVATCRYSTSAGVAYASMSNTFSSTNSMSHSSLVTGLLNGQTKNYYVRCKDVSNNANLSDYLISFSINMATNNPPVISSFVSDKMSGVAPLSVSFMCSASDPNADSLSYLLDFGDGASSASASASHSYSAAGNYSAKCTVNDGHGGSAVKSIAIAVSAPVTPTPTPSVTATPTPHADQQPSNDLDSDHTVSSGGCGQASSGHMLAGFALVLMLVGFRRRENHKEEFKCKAL